MPLSLSLPFIAAGAVLAALLSLDHPALAGSARQSPAAVSQSKEIAVTSKDGTKIGVVCEGSGPTVLFVHGGVGDRTRWTPMFPLLRSKFTACAMDRRGRGASGDSSEYSLAKEAEDVAAVVNSSPGPVFLFGHSYGAVAALEAALLTDRIAKLMLYEPPLHEPVANNLAVAGRVESLVQKGELEQAFVVFQTEIVKQPPEELARMKARPTWAGLVATIAVHPRQMRALSAYRFDAGRMKSVRMPTLLLLGEDTSSPYAKQSIAALRQALPNSTLVMLAGQGHNAMDGGRQALADTIIEFVAGTK
jgi:pimeloyl-ACP methyl ester carboxylesterase